MPPPTLRLLSTALALLALLAAPRCGTDTSGTDAAARAADPPPYAFDAPALRLDLDDDLREISGLTVLPDGRLAAVQDEEGDVFVLDAATGAIAARHRFRKDGDYEGVELLPDGRLFVLRSDGTLYHVEDWASDDADADKQETPLRARHDTEGLGFDPATGRLLIACKEYPGKDLGDVRAVYAFDPDAGRMDERPVYTVDVDAALELIGERRWSTIKPSGLAVHPSTGHVYLLSSTPPAVVVLGADGALRGAWALPRDLLPQPEGIAFTLGGELWVASEGRGKGGILVRYAPTP